jgi:hypothetical protein
MALSIIHGDIDLRDANPLETFQMMDLLRCGRPNDVVRQYRSPYFVQNGDSASQVLWSVLQDIG